MSAAGRRSFSILHLPEVGSTSDWIRANADQFGDGQWVHADRQTAGRGRMGRSWETSQGNLAMSGLIRPQPGEGNLAELGFVAALALHDVISAHVDTARLQLKWPNDLNLDGAKLSGILLEREADLLVLGIGVNVAAAPALPDRATVCLADVGVHVAAAEVAEALADAFARRRSEWREGGLAPIRAAWEARAHPIGTPLWVTSGEGRIAGTYAGLGADGSLLLEGADGCTHVIHAGDVWQIPRQAGEQG